MQSIHCKVSCNDQFRRFLFVGTEFSSLFAQVQQLLALDKEFVLKYKDTDGDLITLTSNEELVCALNYSDGDLLRLFVVLKENALVTADPEVPVCGFPCAKRHFHGGHGWENKHGGHGHHGWEHKHGGHGHHGWEHKHGGHGHHGCRDHFHGRHGGWGPEMFKARLTSKRDFFKSQLDELEKVPEKTPEQQQEVLRLQMKLKRIESRLERGWEKKEMKGKRCGKWDEKRRQKMEKRMRKKEQKDKCSSQNLSIETQTQIAMLKSQIDLFKPAMKEVKIQIKTKKDALKEATGGDPHQLIKELLVLKEKRRAQKNEVKPLKQKICELKYASC